MIELSTPFKQNNRSWLIGLSAALLLALQPFSSYIASLPFIQEEWNMSNTQASMVFSSYLVGYALSSLILLPLTDQVSPGRLLKGGVLVIALSNLLFPLLAYSFWSGAALRFAAGAGHVAAYIPGVQLVAERYAGARRGTAVALFVGAGYAGTTLSYTVMGLLLNYTGSWRLAYLLTALVSLLGVLLAFTLIHEPAQAAKTPGVTTGRRVRGWLDLSVLRHRATALVIVAYALHTAELYLARLWFPLLLGFAFKQQGLSNLEATSLAATLAGFMFMMGILGVFVGGSLSDYLGRSRASALIFSVSGLCSFAAGWLLGLPSAWLIAIGFIYGFTTAADSAIYSTAVTELSPPNRIGSTQAVQSFIGFAIGALVPVVAGSILDWSDSAQGWGWAFSFNGLLAVIGIIALLILYSLPEARQMAGGKR